MYYVTMTDTFMSGWGLAKDLTDKLVFLCDTWEEAKTVSDNARKRNEMKWVNICAKPSYYRSSFGLDYKLGAYYVQIKTKDSYPTWYEKGAFTND